jgi:NAD(P)-dependent dehydrogenase (short-subunit alcohol dehydrogenase family)
VKHIVITGVSRGIGRAAAQHFLDKGWSVIGTSTSGKSDLQDTNLTIFQLDLGDSKSIATCAGLIRKKIGGFDVLVNSAGINPGPDTYPLDIAVLRSTLEIDLIGTIDFTEQLLPLVKPRGRIINLTSSAGDINNEAIRIAITPYRIAKAGVNMYTRALADRLKSQGFIVAALHPGWVRTDMGSPHATKLPEEVAEELYKLATDTIETGRRWENNRVTSW